MRSRVSTVERAWVCPSCGHVYGDGPGPDKGRCRECGRAETVMLVWWVCICENSYSTREEADACAERHKQTAAGLTSAERQRLGDLR
jgi:hypothetical protein